MSVLSSLKDENYKIDRNLYLGHGAIINNDFKLVKANSGNPSMKAKEDMLFKIPSDYSEKKNVKAENIAIYNNLLKAVAPFDAIKSEKEIDRHGGEKTFKAPKEWKINK